MAVPPAPVRVPSQRPLAPSVTSVANDKGDNEMICTQISWHLPYSCGKPRKTSARRLSDEGCATSLRLKWGPLPSNEIFRIAEHVGKGKGKKKERAG